jgi:hypothetical protein
MLFYEYLPYKSKSTFERIPKKPYDIRFWKRRLMYDIHHEKWQLERLTHSNKFYLICACPNFDKTSISILRLYFNSFIQSNYYYPDDRIKLKYPKKLKMKFYPYSTLFKFYGPKKTSKTFKNLLTTNQIHFPFHNMEELHYFIKISKESGIMPLLFYPLVIVNKFKNNFVPLQYFKLNMENNQMSISQSLRLHFLKITKILLTNYKLNIYKKMDDSCEPANIFIDLAGLPNPIHPLKGNNPRVDHTGNLVNQYDENGVLIPHTEEDENEIIDIYVSSDDDEEAVKKRSWVNKFLRRTFG